MKRILTVILLFCTMVPVTMAQNNKDKSKATDQSKFIPITREQAEILVTKIVQAEYQNELKAKNVDKQVLKLKMDALKRKMLDNALRKAYTSEVNERLDRMERLLYLTLLSSKGGNIDPKTLQTIIGVPSGTNTTVAAPILPAKKNTCSNGIGENNSSNALKDTQCNDVPGNSTALNVPGEDGSVETIYVTDAAMENFLKQVFFEFNSSKLSKKGMATLDDMVNLLNANPTLKVVLKGYASPEGNLKYNNKLSAKRVKACGDYIINHGIAKSRLNIDPSGIDSMTKSYPDARRVDIRPAFCL